MRRIAVLGVLLMGFGPAPDDVRPQIASMPGVGIVVATLDAGRSDVRSYGASSDENSPFEIGSVTKTFTATLFADMIVRHEVAPDDPIDRYLPAGTIAPAFDGRRITLEDLATQSSGLPRMPDNFGAATPDDGYPAYDDAKMLAFLRTYRLTRAPGASFEYSNYGFGLLGYLLARRLGVDYATAIRTRILEPLGMSHTSLATVGHDARTVGGHDADGDPTPNWTFAAFAGAGAIVSTPHDMLAFAKAQLARDGLLAAAFSLARTARRATDSPTRRIGYAWLTQTSGIVWHNGGTGGFRSFLGLDPAHDRAIIVFANAFLGAVDALGMHALDPAFPAPPPPADDFVVPAATLERYVGRYRFADESTATISRDARGVVVTFDRPAFRARLHATASDAFAIRSLGIGIRFTETTMIVTQPGQQAETGTRVAP